MKRSPLFFFSLLLFFGCSPATPPVTPQIISVYSTSAAQPWLSELYDCAGTTSVLSRVDEPAAAQIALQVGEPASLASPAYQVDTEEILVVAQRQSPVQNLTVEDARLLFAGQGDPSVQVWVYASGEDVQQIFDRLVMQGQSITPSAHIAPNPQQMSDMLVNEPNTVGILPRHWKAGDAREVLSIGTVPVLAITPAEPEGVIKSLVACLQK